MKKFLSQGHMKKTQEANHDQFEYKLKVLSQKTLRIMSVQQSILLSNLLGTDGFFRQLQNVASSANVGQQFTETDINADKKPEFDF